MRTLVILGGLAMLAMATTSAGAMQPEELVKKVEKTHNAESWYEKGLIVGDLTVQFGDRPAMKAEIYFDPYVSVARFDMENGTQLVFDGDKAWISPADVEMPRARFHLITWPYFIAAPMKLSDPGVNLSQMEMGSLMGEKSYRARMTFESGVGDAPDDWYVLYADAETMRLEGMSYIVTYGKSDLEEAEEEPHAVHYTKYELIGDIPIATEMKFYNWSEEKEFFGEPIGHVTFENIRFEPWAPAKFEKPVNAREDKLPQD